MNLKKVNLVEKYKAQLSTAKGYAILRLPHRAQSIQEVKKKYRYGIKLNLVKTKLLQRVLDIPKNTLSGKNYLCLLHTVENYVKLYSLIREMDYYCSYKKNEVVVEDTVLKPTLTSIRPGPAYKKMESVLKVKLNKGFIEILEESMLFYQGTVIDAQMYDILKDLKLSNKPVYSELIYYKDTTELTFQQCSSLNEILYHIKGLKAYIQTDILEGILQQSNLKELPILLKEKKNRLYDIPLNLQQLEHNLKILPDKLIKQLNLPFNESKNNSLIGIVYLFLYKKLSSKPITYFESETNFQQFIQEFYPMCKHYVNNLYNSLMNLYGEETKTTTSAASAPVDMGLDDLF